MQLEPTEFQDHLVRGLAHRMNNILTLFHGYLGLLLDNQELDIQTMEGLAKIKEGAVQASDLMDRIHSLARPSTLIWRELKLPDFVRNMKPSLQNFCGPRTKFEFDLDDNAPPVWADATRVKTVIFELVRNALESTFATGGKVTVSVRVVPTVTRGRNGKGAPSISLTVTDDGPGVPENVGDKIFQPFFSTKKRKNNNGLGLTVALTFVRQLGGILRSQSIPGNTEFQMLLPSREMVAANR